MHSVSVVQVTVSGFVGMQAGSKNRKSRALRMARTSR